MYITPFVSDPFAKESSMIRRCARGIPQPVARLCDFAAPAVCSLLFAVSARAAEPGETGLAFLKIGVGARAAGMGEAYVAVAQVPTAMYWNPAGIAVASDIEAHASHNEWISDVRYEYLAAVHGMHGHAVGAQLALLHMGDFEGRDSNGNFTESFSAYDFMGGISYGRRILKEVEVGITGKFLYEKIESFTAVGFAGDFGARYRTPLRGLTIGAAATNLGPKMSFEEDDFLLPISARIGAAYRTRSLLEGLIVAGDLRFPNDSDAKGHLGAELQVHEMIALRGGVKMNYDEEAGSFGFGIHYREYDFDYAFTPFSSESELGDGHRFSIGWRAPATPEAVAAETPPAPETTP
jgi:hypothetical protein